MNLQECKFGIIVQETCCLQKEENKIGMISGITENGSGEIIPLIKWSNGKEYPIHPANIKIYKGGKNAKS